MYAGCGAIDEAKDLFIDYKSRDIITWTVLIAALIQQGETKDALTLFECMKQEGLSPDAITFTVTLKACGAMKAVNTGNSIHGEIARLGLLISDVVLGNALIDMYVKFGHLMKAQQVLEGLPCRDTVSWNTLIAGYVQHQQPEKALACFERMQREALPPDAVTFVCLLKACGTLGAVDMGEQIHEQIINQGLMEENIVLGTALVDMYAKCGALTKAQTVLKELSVRDIVSWNTLISSYAHQGQGEEVFHCIEQMQLEGIYPSPITFGCILKACGTVGDIVKGEQIHDVISRQGLIEFHNSLGSALVDMYAKCGSLAKAKEVFDGLPSRDTVSWSSLIAEYVQQGEAEQAFDCFKQMQQEGLRADGITFACMLKACAILGTVNRGRVVHDEILKEGLLGTDAMLDNALVDMYAKCGVLRKAQLVLEEIPFRDVVCWNALIAGYAQQGESDRALSCFRKMELEGFHPDASTFLSLLTSCCHLGLLEEGCKCFISMITRYNITPDVNHYTCMVDLFGRAGQLQKAACLIAQMPFSDHGSVISALLTACRKLGDMSLGRWAFQRALQLDEIDGAVYALMCDIYSITGSQVDTENS
ncbi:hypothetical protein KP509_10G028200 [Ceratopteris richardii]|nr:hypothetical protein KP509_10G028200 [Ceratopteris richardii]